MSGDYTPGLSAVSLKQGVRNLAVWTKNKCTYQNCNQYHFKELGFKGCKYEQTWVSSDDGQVKRDSRILELL